MKEENLLELKGISKSFAGNIALRDIDLVIRPGEMVGLVGANGAGKSTLVKIICGAYEPDRGMIMVGGIENPMESVKDGLQAGIAVAHQQVTIISSLTGAQNILLGHEPQKWGLIDNARELEMARDLLRKFEIPFNISEVCEHLGLGNRKILDILKALSNSPKLLILDEPTATLSNAESIKLFRFLAQLKTAGLAIILVSHHMKEIFSNCDRIVALRDGSKVTDTPTGEISQRELVRLMVGRDVDQQRSTGAPPGREYAVKIDTMKVEDLDVYDFTVRTGEIVGVAGVLGAGQDKFIEALAGVRKPDSSSLELLNKRKHLPKNIREAIKDRIYYISDDRQSNSIFPGLSVEENISAAALDRSGTLGFISISALRERASTLIRQMGIKCTGIDQDILELSGGNQQKSIFSRWLARMASETSAEPLLLLLENPTEGVDVAAKSEIYDLIVNLARSGNSVVISTSDFAELTVLCDRVYYISDGEMRSYLERQEITEDRLLMEVN